MVDVTQREMELKALAEAQAELTKASKAAAVGAMSASLSHELNQPLGAIIVNAQTLLRWLDRDPPDLAAARRSAERMIRDGERASDIIQNTRSLLAHTSGKVETFDLDEFIDETLSLLEHELERSGTTVHVENEATPPITAVRIELQQVSSTSSPMPFRQWTRRVSAIAPSRYEKSAKTGIIFRSRLRTVAPAFPRR